MHLLMIKHLPPHSRNWSFLQSSAVGPYASHQSCLSDGDIITAASFHFQLSAKVTQYILAPAEGGPGCWIEPGVSLKEKSAPQPRQGTHCLVSMFCHREQHQTAYPTRTVVSGPTMMPSKLGSWPLDANVIWRQKYLCWRRSVRGCDADWAEQGNGSLLLLSLKYISTHPQKP